MVTYTIFFWWRQNHSQEMKHDKSFSVESNLCKWSCYFYVIFLDPHPNDEDIFNWKQQWIFSSESNKQKIHSLFFKAKFTAIKFSLNILIRLADRALHEYGCSSVYQRKITLECGFGSLLAQLFSAFTSLHVAHF